MKDLETYISEGFYKTVGADLTQIKDNFEYLKRRIFNTWGFARKYVQHNDTFETIIKKSHFTELPKGTVISMPYPKSDVSPAYAKRGERVTLVFKKLSDSHSDNLSWKEEWFVDSPDISEEIKNSSHFFTFRGPKRQYTGDNVIDSIARAENFLKKDELDKIKIEFSL